MDRAAIHAFISRQRYAVVSSTATNGTPQSALVGIASTSRLEIIFDTVKSFRKYPNLVQDQRAPWSSDGPESKPFNWKVLLKNPKAVG
jgi:Pyridoxamine 5'-phosphate oxidase